MEKKYVTVTTGSGLSLQVYVSGYLWVLKGTSSGSFWSAHITGSNALFDFEVGDGFINALVPVGTFNGQVYLELV